MTITMGLFQKGQRLSGIDVDDLEKDTCAFIITFQVIVEEVRAKSRGPEELDMVRWQKKRLFGFSRTRVSIR